MIRTILKPLSFIPALLLIYMIFSFSSQPGDVSSQLSNKVSYKIVQAADYVFDANLDEWQMNEWANKINFITRKLAHMAEYFLLAIAVSFPLYVYGMHGLLLMLVAGFLCVGVACADEYYQSFVAGRSPSLKDVGIDSIGVFFGIILVRIVGWTGRKTIFRPKKQKQKKIRRGKYRENDPYLQQPYDRPPYQGGYQEPPYDYQRGYTPPPGHRSNYPPPDNQYGYGYDEPPYGNQGGYNQPPYGNQDNYWPPEEDSFIKDPEYTDEWNVDVSDVINNNIPSARNNNTVQQNDDLAYDWGMNPSSRPEVPPPYSEPGRPPVQEPMNQTPPPQPAPKKKTKKDKDWFFDM